ncbi:MAG: Rid family hydrolase [Hyphomonas sp.]|uniref:RidA family protein n=1 Tax=Hyphomonas sp. TaxID=87 RepID=UPI003526C51F
MRTILVSGAVMAALALPACVMVKSDDVTWHSSPDVEHFKGVAIEGMNLPFSKAVRVDDTIYLAGELGIDAATNAIVPGGVGPETTQIFANMARTLSQFDADLGDIVKCTVFLDDMAHYGEMNAAYDAALPDPKPARSTVAVKGLAVGAGTEIECIAVKR